MIIRKRYPIAFALAIVCLLCSVPLFSAEAEEVTAQRVYGADRIETAVQVAKTGWNTAATVLVAPAADSNLVDALAAAPLAGQEKAPILLTDSAALDPKTKQAIIDLKANKVYAIGALSEQTVADLQSLEGLTVEVIKGADRIATAAQIQARINAPAGAFVVGYDALADALSVASYAAANRYLILVANPDGSLSATQKPSGKTYIVGGLSLVADLPGSSRLAGSDRFETNKKILAALEYRYDKVYLANGEQSHLVDALVASALAAQESAPILLGDRENLPAATDVSAKLNAASRVILLGGTSVLPDTVKNSLKYIPASQPIQPVQPVELPPPPPIPLAVANVIISSENSIKVSFNVAPTDPNQVSFALTRGTAPFTFKTAWNPGNTEATLTVSENFTTGMCSVKVQNGTTDLGTTNLNIGEKAVAKIRIISSKLGITMEGKGYAVYQVFDQYGNDITTTNLAREISFLTSVGTVEHMDGVITITPPAKINLLQFPKIAITAQNSKTGVSTGVNLETSKVLGTLSKLSLDTLSHPENKELMTGQASTVWTIDYTAADLDGNPTKDYTLVKNGLILSTIDGIPDSLPSSNQFVRVRLIQDPLDLTKATIQVTTDPNVYISTDLPVTITAMCYSGTSSLLALTLKREATTDSFELSAPSGDIAVGEQELLPFTAYDQYGQQVLKYKELLGDKIIFSPADKMKLTENPDGTAGLLIGPFVQNGSQMITAQTTTGKISTLTITVQQSAKANTLTLNNAILQSAMQMNAIQKLDFGLDYGGFSVTDQYDRSLDMIGDPKNYEIQPVSSDPKIVSVSGTAVGSGVITLTAGTQPGQANLTFNLVDKTNPAVVISSKSTPITVVQDSDITSYTLDSIPYALYAGSDLAQPRTDRDREYSANPKVYGKTNAGSKVLLAGNPIQGAHLDNTMEFKAEIGPGAYDSIRIYAGTLPSAKTSANATLTVSVKGTDGTIHSLTTPVTSTTAIPTANTLAYFAATSTPGIALDSVSDTIIVNLSQAASSFSVGKSLAQFTPDGRLNPAGVYFYAIDQYRSEGIKLAWIMKDRSNSTLTDAQFALSDEGIITTPPTASGDVVLTAVIPKGTKTIRLRFVK